MSNKKLLCPLPPIDFSVTPTMTTLKKGSCLFRVHHQKYEGTAFNPGVGQPSRFSPIVDSVGNNIPTLYAGNSKNSALAESVFRNLVSISPAITRFSLRKQLLSTLQNTRKLRLVDLTQNGLRRLGLKRNQLLESEYDSYKQTARWAEALHNLNDEIDGMVWISTQYDTEKSILLFGDRVFSKDLLIINQGDSLYDGSGLELVLEFANEAGITIFL